MAATLTLSACGALPWAVDYGQPPDLCAPAFGAGTKLEWAGRGNPKALGLLPPSANPRGQVGDIYVGPADPAEGGAAGERVVCIIYEDGTYIGGVLEGWRPP